jgi:uncharacterized protein (DUF433 family)
MILPDFLAQEPDGEIRLVGHRIGLYHIVQAYVEGATAEMLASRYPTLTLSLVHRAIAFYLDKQIEVDAYVAACSAVLAEQRSEGRQIDLSSLRKRLAAGQLPASTAPVPHVG